MSEGLKNKLEQRNQPPQPIPAPAAVGGRRIFWLLPFSICQLLTLDGCSAARGPTQPTKMLLPRRRLSHREY